MTATRPPSSPTDGTVVVPPAADRPETGAAAGATAPAEHPDASALISLSGAVQGTFARVADRHGLTVVQGRLLCVLAQGPRGMADLARTFDVGKANITGLVDRAAARGLLERAPVPGDRRAAHVRLTAEGLRTASAFHQDVTHELEAAIAPLSEGARAALREAAAVVGRHRSDLDQVPPGNHRRGASTS